MMNKRFKKILLITALLILAMVCMTGCKPSKKKVESSKYYKELQKKYNKVKKENEKLQKANDSQEKVSEAEKRAEKYLAKIARDSLVKMEVGFADDMEESVVIEDEGFFVLGTNIGERANRTTKYTPEALIEKFQPVYQYILFDEDNAVYEIMVYESDYVLFSDLPNNVYYVPGASIMGDAFLRYRSPYPASNLFHRMADSPIMTDSKGRCYENATVLKTANYVNRLKKVKSSRDKAEKEWKKKKGIKADQEVDSSEIEPESKTYTYYSHSNKLYMTLYDKYISILNVDGNHIWYEVTKEDIQGIKDILRSEREALKKKQSVSKDSDDTEESHSKEIEEESVIGSDESSD